MARLIDADGLVSNTIKAAKDVGFYRPIYEGFIEAIEESPTVDAQPVVYGEWTICEDDYHDGTIYTCSVCKEDFVTIDGTPAQNLWNYCPVCGAKMNQV